MFAPRPRSCSFTPSSFNNLNKYWVLIDLSLILNLIQKPLNVIFSSFGNIVTHRPTKFLFPLERTKIISLFFNKYSLFGNSSKDIYDKSEVLITEWFLKSPTPKHFISILFFSFEKFIPFFKEPISEIYFIFHCLLL